MLRRVHNLVAVLVVALANSGSAAQSPKPILDQDPLWHRPGEPFNSFAQKSPVGAAELVNGKFGKAIQFSFAGGGAGFLTASVRRL